MSPYLEENLMPQVLIIDDEPGIRKLLSMILRRKGYSVETAADGEEGLRKFGQDPADLIITDIIMPDMDGLQVIQTLRRERPGVNIISISGGGRLAAEKYLDLAKKLGVCHAFEKPIDRDVLLSAVSKLLQPADETSAPASIARSSGEQIKAQVADLAAIDNLVPMVETLPHFFWVLNRNRQVVLANRLSVDRLGMDKLKSLYGLRPGEALNCHNAALSPFGCGTAPACKTCGALKAIVSAQQGQPDTQECRIRREVDGNALDLRVWTRPLALGDTDCIVFQAHDISNEKRREALERTFFHDLLNVAGGLKNGLGMLSELSPEEQAELLPMLVTSGKGLVDEIEAQKDLLAIEAGTYDAKPIPFRTSEILQAAYDLYRHHPVAAGRHLRVENAIPETVLTSDRRLMARVLGNMVKNALEACAEGDRVTMGCMARGDGVAFWVHNPQFMPEEVQMQVFQRSYSTKGRGRGLGTFGMRLLTERYLQGEIGFTSSATSGTTFTACYPLAIESIETAQAPAASL
jgi:DNA-binding response OmpR family regulator